MNKGKSTKNFKEREWDAYRTHVSDWELGKYLVIY